MTKSLVVVESPAKAKTIKKYLGKGYEVLASYGHVRDLVPKEGAVDPAHDFAMNYQLIEKNTKHVDAIVKSLRECDTLLLATDPDREGEAISWHLAQIVATKRGMKEKEIKRVVFHEITKKAIQDAVANPRDISMELVNAQQARRALDYLVGFNLSPLLWKKIRRGLSAGRVQSPALRLIVEREIEIENFQQQEYWSIVAECYDKTDKEKIYNAKLIKYQDKKLEQFSIITESAAQDTVSNLNKLAADSTLKVVKVDKKQRKRNPSPPFTTSTLQQEASRKLGFGAQKTMRVAQQLYEGIDIAEGSTGLITYMRTDSVTLSNDALEEIRSCIVAQYGNDNCPDEPRYFKTKSKNAQEAHEAIRPTACMRSPRDMRAFLNNEQFRLYELIWKRTMACQMAQAIVNTVAAELACGNSKNIFKANGSTIEKLGFLAVYQEGVDDHASDGSDDDGKFLPHLTEGDIVPFNKIIPRQHFTEPPPRYGEASLVKTLEEFGIGRPSTYASIISTLQNREYVMLENKRFHPTDVGRVVNKFLTSYFNNYVDYEFTAKLEDELDAVARGEMEWVPLLGKFWDPFISLISNINDTVQRSDVTHEKIDEKCPQCGKGLSIRLGRSGRFIGCDAYPECSYTRSLEADSTPDIAIDHNCPKCSKDLVIKHGRYGKFIGCSGYPDCRHIEPIEQPEDSNVTCPKCRQGTILKRKSRRGKIFFSCGRYPDCDYAIWDEPINEPCPECNWPILSKKITKRSGAYKMCPQKDCNFKEALPDQEDQDFENHDN